MAKIVNFKLSEDEFLIMSISKIMVPLQSPGFLLYVVEFAIVLATFVTRLIHSDMYNISAFLFWFFPNHSLGGKAKKDLDF